MHPAALIPTDILLPPEFIIPQGPWLSAALSAFLALVN